MGVFPEFAGIEYENFMAVANKMRTDYDFFHTSDASILPHGDLTVKGPLLRLFKPFDELFVDSQVNIFLKCTFSSLVTSWVCFCLYTKTPVFCNCQDFDNDAIKKFIEVSGFPNVVTFDADPTNHKFIERYYSTPSAKVSKQQLPSYLVVCSFSTCSLSFTCTGWKS